jgi:hypothetical protein
MFYTLRIHGALLAIILGGLLGSASLAYPSSSKGGVFSLVGLDQVPNQMPELASPDVAGASFRFRWSTIEPRPGEYHWEKVDQAIALAQRTGKKVMLRIVGGALSPEWIYQAGAKWASPSPEKLAKAERSVHMTPQRLKMIDQIQKVPVVWDPVYLKNWYALVEQFGRRYDGNPSVYAIQMAGGGLNAEMTLYAPIFDWPRYGYSDAVAIKLWEDIIDAYQKAFPRTPTILNIHEPIRNKSQVARPVVEYCLQKYPGKVFFQQDGLNARVGPNHFRTLIRMAAGRTTVGYQMTGSRDWNPQLVGDRWTAFSKALDDGASYLEVYHSDLVDPAYHDAVHRLAVALAQK